jgi:hypothetical protein
MSKIHNKALESKKLSVRHHEPMKFSTSTSYNEKGAYKKTFKTSEGRHKDFVKGWNSSGYQKHLDERAKRRGEDK